MRIKARHIFIAVIAVGVLILLIDCFRIGGHDMEFPTTETGFPIGATRGGDHAQIKLGMHRNDIENILTRPNDFWGDLADFFEPMGWIRDIPETAELYSGLDGFVLVYYDDYNMARAISISSRDWVIANEIFVGMYIQSVINNDNFPNITHNTEERLVAIREDLENPRYAIVFSYDLRRNITQIHLMYLPAL